MCVSSGPRTPHRLPGARPRATVRARAPTRRYPGLAFVAAHGPAAPLEGAVALQELKLHEIRVVFIASDTLGERIAGPGIRCWELSRVLSRHFQVTLAVPPILEAEDATLAEPDFSARIQKCATTSELRKLVDESDVVVTLGAIVAVYPFLTRIDKALVFDAYDPFLLAGLEQHRHAKPETSLQSYERYLLAHLRALKAADFVMCASERQRDYWLGMLSAMGRVNPFTYDGDPCLERLIRVVPFGLPSGEPKRGLNVIKGVVPGVGVKDRVVLWGGGVWDWFDATTAVKAMSRIAEKRTDVKLFFMGTKRPNALVAKSSAVDEVVDLSRQLGLSRQVFFNDWVPYDDRPSYLLEADLGLSLHPESAESRFAFRTRFLDYFWAGLPVVATEGDTMSEVVRRSEVGKLVPPGDDEAVASAILDLLDRPDLKSAWAPRFEALRATYAWDVAAKPLVEFCRNPRKATDKDKPALARANLIRGFREWMPARVKEGLSEGALGRIFRKMKRGTRS